MLDQEESFDWHSATIIKMLGHRMIDTALSPFRSLSGIVSSMI